MTSFVIVIVIILSCRTLYSWGCNHHYELTNQLPFSTPLLPQEIKKFGTVTDICAGYMASFVAKEGLPVMHNFAKTKYRSWTFVCSPKNWQRIVANVLLEN